MNFDDMFGNPPTNGDFLADVVGVRDLVPGSP
jgi:hypothetical protein